MMQDKMIWDPLRRKNVPLTPEERVRQWFISVLGEDMKVPVYKMMSEVGMKYGEGSVRKEYRADIVVYDRNSDPLMIVECKSPEVELSQAVMDQALRYDMVLGARYVVLTNGTHTHIFRITSGGQAVCLKKAPTYKEMADETSGMRI